MMKVTHSAALEPPTPSAWCEDCGHVWEGCRCGEPTCEVCGETWADERAASNDEMLWMCRACIAGEVTS